MTNFKIAKVFTDRIDEDGLKFNNPDIKAVPSTIKVEVAAEL